LLLTANHFVLSAALFLVVGTAMAADKSTSATRITEAPIIDGVLDEMVWSQAVIVDDLHQVNPVEFGEQVFDITTA